MYIYIERELYIYIYIYIYIYNYIYRERDIEFALLFDVPLQYKILVMPLHCETDHSDGLAFVVC